LGFDEESVMQNRVFVGGIPWSATDADLKEAFEKFGSVTDAKVITDKETHRSRGFGFVTYEKEEGAQCAIDEGDGMEMMGRSLRVDFATQKENNNGRNDRGPRRGRGHSRR
jgi:RNA recognition motif-containing protein